MKRWFDFVYLLAVVATVVCCFLIAKWLFTAVMGSDMPDWLKYVILR